MQVPLLLDTRAPLLAKRLPAGALSTIDPASLLRCACRCIFDIDSIDIGPERRQYLDHQLSRLWENNSQVPWLRYVIHVSRGSPRTRQSSCDTS